MTSRHEGLEQLARLAEKCALVEKRARLLEKRARFLKGRRALWAGVTAGEQELRRARRDELWERLEEVRSARFLLATAVRLLPQSERARYLEEFRAELLDVPRNTRLRHALSLLHGVFVLRLRRGRKNKATDAPVGNATFAMDEMETGAI